MTNADNSNGAAKTTAAMAGASKVENLRQGLRSSKVEKIGPITKNKPFPLTPVSVGEWAAALVPTHNHDGHYNGEAGGEPTMTAMLTATYIVEGLTCAACLAEVMDRVRVLPRVSGVAVDLVLNGHSSLFISGDTPLATESVRASVEDAGFQVSETSQHQARHLQRTFTGRTRRPLRTRGNVKTLGAIRPFESEVGLSRTHKSQP